MKKSGSLPQPSARDRAFGLKSEIWVFRIFLIATLAFRHLKPSVLSVSKKFPGREKPNGFKQKGENQTLKLVLTMHSTIYQISTEPIAERDFLHIDNIVAGEIASISYVSENNEEGRNFDIKCLVEHILPKGMFMLSDDNILTYTGGFTIWRKSHFDNIKALSAQLTPANVMKWSGPIGQLKKSIVNPLDTEALFVTEFYGGAGTAECSADLMDMVSKLKKGDKLYLGAILGYHN